MFHDTTFANAVANQMTTTTNGMKARVSSADACTDLFFTIGASRGKNIIPQFVAAFAANEDLAARIALWARDIRQGAGERKLFKDILSYLETAQPTLATQVISKIEELGRWDDMLIYYKNQAVEAFAMDTFCNALLNGNGLACKWAPRKGQWAIKLRQHIGLTPKQYRKLIVNGSKTVEQQMCAKDWNNINFSRVPSLASARYRTAFFRNAEAKFTEYLDKLKSGDTSVKINAGAVYPYDITKGICSVGPTADITHRVAQWKALPNYIGEANILPMVDVSASMKCAAGGSSKSSTSCLDIAVSLGMYCAEKNKGNFKDLILTFSGDPQLVKLQGNIVQKYRQLKQAEWGMNTDLVKAFDKILKTAIENKVPQTQMPEILLVLSDMQFDEAQHSTGFWRTDPVTPFNESAIEMIQRKYQETGYKMPQIVFWNLDAYDNCPVKFNQTGTALVSGFSPSIMKAVLAVNFEDFTPEAIMLQTIMAKRYDY